MFNNMLTLNLILFEIKNWRTWVSIPVPPACKAGALPCELVPLFLKQAVYMLTTILLAKKCLLQDKKEDCILLINSYDRK